MHEKARLRVTRDYDLFEMDGLNRDLGERPILLASMKAHGFLPVYPIRCSPPNGKGKMKIRGGHHRFFYAKRLKLPIWYVVDYSDVSIYEAEAGSGVKWDLRDFITSYAKDGNDEYQRVLAFQKKHGLTQGVSLGLMGGESAGSQNKNAAVKSGRFKVAADLSHAKAVVDVTDHFRVSGISFATQASFVKALSMVLRVPECEASVLKHRLAQAPGVMQKRTNTEGYLDELDALYNHGAKAKRLALKFRAREVGRERQASFGFGGRRGK